MVPRASERAELSESQFGMAARSLHRSLDSKLCEYKMRERCCPFPLSFARFPISLSFPLCWVESVETALEMASLIRLPSFPASLPLFGTRQIAWCLAHTAHTQHTSSPLSSFSRVRERAQLRLRGGKQEIRPLRNYGRKEARRVSGRTSDETGPSLSPFRTSF